MPLQPQIPMNLRNESIGTIQHFSWQENGLSGLAGNKQFSIKFYTSKICRIQASKHEAFDENPFSVVLPPQKVSIDAKETDQFSIRLRPPLEVRESYIFRFNELII